MKFVTFCVSTLTLLLLGSIMVSGCSKSSHDLDKMLEQGNYDKVIELAQTKLKDNPEDYALYIIIGDAYVLKGKKFNADKGVSFTPEAAAYAKQAIEYFENSKEYHESMRVDQKIAGAGTMTYRY